MITKKLKLAGNHSIHNALVPCCLPVQVIQFMDKSHNISYDLRIRV